MKFRLAAPLCSGLLAALALPVQAADIQNVYESLGANQYMQIMIATIIMVAVFIGIFFFLGKRHSLRTNVNPVTKLLGMAFAILCIIFGTILLIIDFIVLIKPFAAAHAFDYIVQLFYHYFPEQLVLGIIMIGSTGLLLYLVGFYIMIVLQGSKALVKDTETYRIQTASQLDMNVSKGNVEYSKIAYRVTSWETGEPIRDEKIRLETKDGTLMMIKYTDSAGEVDFGKLRGKEGDYFAYVEGDRERQEYRFVSLT